MFYLLYKVLFSLCGRPPKSRICDRKREPVLSGSEFPVVLYHRDLGSNVSMRKIL